VKYLPLTEKRGRERVTQSHSQRERVTWKGQTGLNGYGLVHRADEDYLKEMNIPCKAHLVTLRLKGTTEEQRGATLSKGFFCLEPEFGSEELALSLNPNFRVGLFLNTFLNTNSRDDNASIRPSLMHTAGSLYWYCL
jgi:hypothetical protein